MPAIEGKHSYILDDSPHVAGERCILPVALWPSDDPNRGKLQFLNKQLKVVQTDETDTATQPSPEEPNAERRMQSLAELWDVLKQVKAPSVIAAERKNHSPE